ncbi:hypothetical protein C0991_006720 [Blastosporella zonata]|nr:hypothetical protein C0991_006720 [Blastosporella zonata]
MPAPPLPSSTSAISRNVIQRPRDGEDPWRQNNLEPPPDLSSSSSSCPYEESDSHFTDVDLSASIATALPPLYSPDLVPERRVPYEEANETDLNLRVASDVVLDPFLDAKPVFPFATCPSQKGCDAEDAEPLLFTLPLCTSTPPRKGGKGHKISAPGTLANLENVNISDHLIERDSLPSPTETEPMVDTPSAKRQRSSSLHQSIAFGSFTTPPPAWSTTPIKPMPSIVVQGSTPPSSTFTSSSQELIFKLITPLRIVKRKAAQDRSSTTSEVSRAVITAVRDAFVESRKESEAEATIDPRDLLNRASVATCDAVLVSIGSSKSGMAPVHEAEETGEYTQEAVSQTPATPPPPYALSNPNGLKADAAKAFLDTKRFSISTCASTELQYLMTTPGTTPASSVDSCLDDILASFEHLMATLPEFQASRAKYEVPGLAVAAKEKIGLEAAAAAAALRTSGVEWSDVLHLENY